LGSLFRRGLRKPSFGRRSQEEGGLLKTPTKKGSRNLTKVKVKWGVMGKIFYDLVGKLQEGEPKKKRSFF